MGVDSVESSVNMPQVCGVHTQYGGNVITLTQEYQQGEKALDGHLVLKAVSRIQLPFVVEMCLYPSV